MKLAVLVALMSPERISMIPISQNYMLLEMTRQSCRNKNLLHRCPQVVTMDVKICPMINEEQQELLSRCLVSNERGVVRASSFHKLRN